MKRPTPNFTETEVKSAMDRLYREVESYRSSAAFRELLRFISRFKNISPYNAFLVHEQRPGARYVLTPKEWEAHGRLIKPNARPIVILQPFGPVRFVFDIGDTMTANASTNKGLFDYADEQELIDKLSEPFKTPGKEPTAELYNIMENLCKFGIDFEYMDAGADYGGNIRLTDKNRRRQVCIRLSTKRTIRYNAPYLVAINRQATTGQVFATICHELAHFFCGHIAPATDKWPSAPMHLSTKDEEFEAETTSWIVCERLGIKNTSEEYLTGYVLNEIPQAVSPERILVAANSILTMAAVPMNYRDCYLYKYDDEFKRLTSKSSNPNRT